MKLQRMPWPEQACEFVKELCKQHGKQNQRRKTKYRKQKKYRATTNRMQSKLKRFSCDNSRAKTIGSRGTERESRHKQSFKDFSFLHKGTAHVSGPVSCQQFKRIKAKFFWIAIDLGWVLSCIEGSGENVKRLLLRLNVWKPTTTTTTTKKRSTTKHANKNKNTTLEEFNFGLSVCQDVPQEVSCPYSLPLAPTPFTWQSRNNIQRCIPCDGCGKRPQSRNPSKCHRHLCQPLKGCPSNSVRMWQADRVLLQALNVSLKC